MPFKKFPFAFVFCLVLILLRAHGRIFQAEIWAEDGVIFLNEALSFGWRSLFIPATGYFHFIQRAAVLIPLNTLPLEYLAAGMAFFAILIQAFVISRWASTEYEWLLSHPLSRWMLCTVLCLGPGLNEMAGTLCNINWFLTVWIALILLKDPKKEITKGELLLLVPLLLSIGTGVLLLPLAVWRYSKRPKALAIVLGIFLTYTLVLIFIRDPAHTQVPQIKLGEWIKTYLRHFRISSLLQPVLGDKITVVLNHGKGVKWGGFLSYTLLLTLLTWGFRHRRNLAIQASALFLFSFSLWLFLVWIGRTSSITYFQEPLFESFFLHRYSFPMSWPALLIWFLFFDSFLKSKRLPLWIFGAWVGVMAFYRFPIPSHSHEMHWKGIGKNLSLSRATGCPRRVRVKVFPGEAFDFDYSAPLAMEAPCQGP